MIKLSEAQKDALYTVAQQVLIALVHSNQKENEAWRNAGKKYITNQATITAFMKKGVLDGQCDLTEAGIAEAKKIYGNTTHRRTVERQSWDDAVAEGIKEIKEIREAREHAEDEWNEYLGELPELAGYGPAEGRPFTVRWRSIEFARVPEIAVEDKRAPHAGEDRYQEADWVFSGGAVSYMTAEALEDYRAALEVAQTVMESLIARYKDAPVKSYV